MSEGGVHDALRAKRFVLGTAGHIDHGKTSLVRALTGVETDRLPEEKARGITIDLGFAPLDLASGTRLSIVDVPGHERLIRNMVAGASGIDFVLLVVAADEGVMPQTREHLAVCSLLGLRRGVVALTKIDLVDEEMAELAEEEVRELLAGSSLDGAEILPVSCREGTGIDALKHHLDALASDEDIALPRAALPRLFVDRVFSARGFGTVVTGTLAGASLSVGDEVRLEPGGRSARVRGLESHGTRVDVADAGARTAVNLQGIDRDQVTRGDLVVIPGRLTCTASVDAELEWLPSAPPQSKRFSAQVLSGTAERLARITPLGGREISSGERGFVRIHFEGDPMPLLPGDRFVVQGFARTPEGGSTYGGGRVIDTAPPRRRPSDPLLVRGLAILAGEDFRTALAERITRTALSGVRIQHLVEVTGVSENKLVAELQDLEKDGVIVRSGEFCIGADAIGQIETRILGALADYHAREALREGQARAALAGDLPENVTPEASAAALERLIAAGRVIAQQDSVRLAEHKVTLDDDKQALADRVERAMRDAALEPPSLKEWEDALGQRGDTLRELFAFMVRQGKAVAAPGDFFFDPEAVNTLRGRVRAYLVEHDDIATPDYKALIGTSRKHAVPLMELFDAERLTLRVGNKRRLRGARETGDKG